MATISSPGVGSGLDVNGIVTQLMTIERQPISQLRAQETKLDTKISAFGKLQGAVSALQDAARALTGVATWQAATAASSDAAAAAAVVSGAPSPGSYSLRVDQLAQRQTAASATLAQAATFSAGTLQLQMGRVDASGAFAADAARAPVSIAIADGDTLAQVRDKINAAGSGVTASLVNDGAGTRMVLRSSETGAAQAFRVAATDAGGAGAVAPSALSFDPSGGGTGGLSQTLAARDAAFSIDGLALTSATNRVAGALEGVTLDLKKAGAEPVEVQVARDTDSLKAAVKKFTDAYNALHTVVSDQTRYDPGSKTAGALQGSNAVMTVQGRLRAILRQEVAGAAAAGGFARLSDIGITAQKDGSLGVDDTKLGAALASPDKVRSLFAAVDADPARTGFAQRFQKATVEILGVDGAISNATASLQRTKRSLDDRQEALERRALATEERLRRQYTALDTQLSKIQSTDFSQFYKSMNDD